MTNSLKIVLVCPRIAANVGNVARTCQALNAELHLIRPLGFHLDGAQARRAAVGFWDEISPIVHRDAESFWAQMHSLAGWSFYFVEKDGPQIYSEVLFPDRTVLIFGNEEIGVEPEFWKCAQSMDVSGIQIPMLGTRCLNLATSVGIAGFEVFRQWRNQRPQEFEGRFVNPERHLDLSICQSPR